MGYAPARTAADDLSVPTSSAPTDVLVARQPILDARLGVVGYELLFRTPGATGADVTQAEQASSQVIVDAIGEIGLDRLAGGRPAHVNVSRELLLAARPLPLPADRVVVELLEDQVVDDELVAVARELVAAGFTLALDDFVYAPALEPLLELAGIVKLDVLSLGRDGTLAQLERLRGRDLTRLAEKVETHDEFAFCRDAGFELFQGYFYARPELVRGRGVPSASVGALGTLAELQRAAGCFDELAEVIGRDVGLSYKLLRYANSAFTGVRRSVGSVREALLLLGAQTVQQWATVLTLAGIGDRPQELTTTGLLRARTCQRLVSGDEPEVAARAFTTGLFSVLDALLEAPMEDVLTALPLEPAVADALLYGEGAEGAALGAVLAYERGTPPSGSAAAHDVRAVGEAYREALGFTQALAASAA
jgi:c-di-GMP phosphodiesterase